MGRCAETRWPEPTAFSRIDWQREHERSRSSCSRDEFACKWSAGSCQRSCHWCRGWCCSLSERLFPDERLGWSRRSRTVQEVWLCLELKKSQKKLLSIDFSWLTVNNGSRNWIFNWSSIFAKDSRVDALVYDDERHLRRFIRSAIHLLEFRVQTHDFSRVDVFYLAVA